MSRHARDDTDFAIQLSDHIGSRPIRPIVEYIPCVVLGAFAKSGLISVGLIVLSLK